MLRAQAIREVAGRLLPDDRIHKIVLIGSSVKESFGMYDPPGFRGSLYSDFDFIVFVDDEYEIPDWLEPEPNGRPLPDDNYNLAFRNRNVVAGKYDVEVFFVRRTTTEVPELRTAGERAGLPMSARSRNRHLVIYHSHHWGED